MEKTYRNQYSLSEDRIYASKKELLYYLNFLDTHPVIQQFLNSDNFYCLADKYLIAMVFVYFKRAGLHPHEYTYLNFFAGLCLAHSMEEDMNLSCAIYPWALGKNQVIEKLPNFLKLKNLLWQAMDHRAAVSHHCCVQLISISQNHSIWKRERLPLHLQTYFFNSCAHRCSDSEDTDTETCEYFNRP